MNGLTAQPGTYALLLTCQTAQPVMVGKLGPLAVRPGWYVYVGSAFGPGGLAARVARHARRKKTRRWHIDYLTAVVDLTEVWYTVEEQCRECQWAELFRSLRGASMPLAGFGSSDCDCPAHLFSFRKRPSWPAFRRRVQRVVPDHGPIARWRPSLQGPIRPPAAAAASPVGSGRIRP